MTCLPALHPHEVLWLGKNKSRVISHCGVQQTNTLGHDLSLVGQKKPRLYLSLALTVVKVSTLCFKKVP